MLVFLVLLTEKTSFPPPVGFAGGTFKSRLLGVCNTVEQLWWKMGLQAWGLKLPVYSLLRAALRNSTET